MYSSNLVVYESRSAVDRAEDSQFSTHRLGTSGVDYFYKGIDLHNYGTTPIIGTSRDGLSTEFNIQDQGSRQIGYTDNLRFGPSGLFETYPRTHTVNFLSVNPESTFRPLVLGSPDPSGLFFQSKVRCREVQPREASIRTRSSIHPYYRRADRRVSPQSDESFNAEVSKFIADNNENLLKRSSKIDSFCKQIDTLESFESSSHLRKEDSQKSGRDVRKQRSPRVQETRERSRLSTRRGVKGRSPCERRDIERRSSEHISSSRDKDRVNTIRRGPVTAVLISNEEPKVFFSKWSYAWTSLQENENIYIISSHLMRNFIGDTGKVKFHNPPTRKHVKNKLGDIIKILEAEINENTQETKKKKENRKKKECDRKNVCLQVNELELEPITQEYLVNHCNKAIYGVTQENMERSESDNLNAYPTPPSRKRTIEQRTSEDRPLRLEDLIVDREEIEWYRTYRAYSEGEKRPKPSYDNIPHTEARIKEEPEQLEENIAQTIKVENFSPEVNNTQSLEFESISPNVSITQSPKFEQTSPPLNTTQTMTFGECLRSFDEIMNSSKDTPHEESHSENSTQSSGENIIRPLVINIDETSSTENVQSNSQFSESLGDIIATLRKDWGAGYSREVYEPEKEEGECDSDTSTSEGHSPDRCESLKRSRLFSPPSEKVISLKSVVKRKD